MRSSRETGPACVLGFSTCGQPSLDRTRLHADYGSYAAWGETALAQPQDFLARQFATIINGDDAEQLDPWLVAAEASELNALAKGIRRDIDAVRAAIIEPWTTSPVECQINRVKAIKRQMHGRAKYPLLKQRVLIAA